MNENKKSWLKIWLTSGVYASRTVFETVHSGTSLFLKCACIFDMKRIDLVCIVLYKLYKTFDNLNK